MKFTPGQVQETLQLSQATFRHWRRALPPLGGRNGHTPCFTSGDLLAMAVVKAITEDGGTRVGRLHGVAGALFEHCAGSSWAALERSTLIIELSRARVNSVPEIQPVPVDRLAIILPYRPIIAALRERLLMEQVEVPQGTLRFPPTALAGDRRRGDVP
jgi:hypothetical protein